MSTDKQRNLVGHAAITNDQRSLAGKRRCQAQRTMNAVTLELIDQALANGVPAQYVLLTAGSAHLKCLAIKAAPVGRDRYD